MDPLATRGGGTPSTPERQALLVECMPQIVWTAGPDGRADYCNQRWYAYSGLSPEESVGDGWLRAVHPDDLESCRTTWTGAILSGEDYEQEYRLRRYDGVYLWHLSRAVPIRDAEGRIVQWLGTSTEIQDRKHAEQTVEEQRQELDDFLSIVAHDLKRPLVSLHGLLSILHEEAADQLEQEARSDFGLLFAECDRMRDIIRVLGDIARIGRMPVARECVSLRALLQSVVRRFESAAAEKHAKFVVDCGDEAAVLAREQVEEALRHLLDNALRHGCTQTGCTVTLRAGLNDDEAWIEVQDEGPGIAPEYHRRVFELFRQLDRHTGGAGVGLAAVQRLMRRVGGRVELRSGEAETGAGFVLRFPVQMQC